MNWARDVMAIRPELEEIANGPVDLQEWDYGFSVTCAVNGVGVNLFRTLYQDPKTGEWFGLNSSVRDHVSEGEIEGLKVKSFSVDDAKESLRTFVGQVAGTRH